MRIGIPAEKCARIKRDLVASSLPAPLRPSTLSSSSSMTDDCFDDNDNHYDNDDDNYYNNDNYHNNGNDNWGK